MAGPLIVAAVLTATADSYRRAFLTLAVPAVLVMMLLLWLRHRVPDPGRFELLPPRAPAGPARAADSGGLPRRFWTYLGFTALTTIGYATFGVLAFHLAHRHVVPIPVVPIVYAAAMGVDAVAALASGWLYDRVGLRVLAVVPVLSAIVPALAFTTAPAAAVTGVLAWGAVLGLQESTMRATVADLVPTTRRGTAYGIFAAGFGAATLAGGVLAGVLYDRSIAALVTTVAVIQALALIVFLRVLAAPIAAGPPSAHRPRPR